MDDAAWADHQLVPTSQAHYPIDASPGPTHYALAGEALRKMGDWCFATPDGQPRSPKDAKIRLLAVATVVNPDTFSAHNYNTLAKANGFTRAILAYRVKEFSKTFGIAVRSNHGSSTSSHLAQRNRSMQKSLDKAIAKARRLVR